MLQRKRGGGKGKKVLRCNTLYSSGGSYNNFTSPSLPKFQNTVLITVAADHWPKMHLVENIEKVWEDNVRTALHLCTCYTSDRYDDVS